MKLIECRRCGEVQRDINIECVACGGEGFKGVEPLILGETLKELYGRWRERSVFELYDDGYENYLKGIEEFLLDHSIGREVDDIKEEIKDLREYLELFNKNVKEIYGYEDKLATHLISIKDDELFVILARAVMYYMEIS